MMIPAYTPFVLFFYPITMATDSVSGGYKSPCKESNINRKFVAFNYNTTLCTNRNINARFVLLPWQKGYKLVITRFLGLPAQYSYSASASPRPHIVFCLQPSEVGYNYYIPVRVILRTYTSMSELVDCARLFQKTH